MRRKQALLLLALVAALGFLAVKVAALRKAAPAQVAEDAAPLAVDPPPVPGPPPVEPPPEVVNPAVLPEAAAPQPELQPASQTNSRTRAARSKAGPPVAKDPPTTDHLARAALAFVGADPDAELYWAETINDSTIPADERRNLIEDLNEDGLSDPRRPTTEDLPLIVTRLALIEQMAPDAMDQVNAEAFAEAHKDLRQMYQRLTGQSWPAGE